MSRKSPKKVLSNTPSALRKRKWRAENPERYLRNNREAAWRLWGIDIDEANKIRDSVKECFICGLISDKLHVDHIHGVGKIRGMLCPTCNKGLGLFKDNPKLLQRAAEYVTL